MAIYSNMLLTMVATKEAAIKLQDELYSKMEAWKKNQELLKNSYGKPYQLDFKVKTPEEIVKIMLECNSSLMIADYEGADYFNTPKESGFKAFVYYLTIDGINIEIKLMTSKMRDWTNQTHDECDIKTYGKKLKKQL